MMTKQHIFKASLNWKGQSEQKAIGKRTYIKSHTVEVPDKPTLYVSAAKAFKGDPSLYNPEDLLLSSLMSCHMMSFLYVCSKNSVEILSYEDHAEALLNVDASGSGKIIEVKLYPKVQFCSDMYAVEFVNHLHVEANKLCFIANSCNFDVLHFPSSYNVK